jgi:hypothetical protein
MFAPNGRIAIPEVIQLMIFMEQLAKLGALCLDNGFDLLIFDGKHGGKIQKTKSQEPIHKNQKKSQEPIHKNQTKSQEPNHKNQKINLKNQIANHNKNTSTNASINCIYLEFLI